MPSVDVSIVMGVNAHADRLFTSLETVLQQKGMLNWECLIVTNGGFELDARCRDLIQANEHFRLIRCRQAGLTAALVLGCKKAQGELIARLDVGDVMVPERLHLQKQAFAQSPDLVLATSAVEVCGPCWEPLWVNQGTESLAGTPIHLDQLPANEGLAIDIPHHSSVMIRRSAYEAVGGYRSAFYFGQDWDLWYRLASAGLCVHLPQVLTRVRLFSEGLSSRHWREQRAIAKLSLACHQARRSGQSEAPLLEQAASIRPRPHPKRFLALDGRRGDGAYFIAEALRRNGDRRCRIYFKEALRFGFWKPRIWLRALHSLVSISEN